MTEEEVGLLADAILRDKLKSAGYDNVTVRFDEDNDGDPAIYLDANLAPDTPVVDAKIFIEAFEKLRAELIDKGELRFPYLYTKHPDDLDSYDLDAPPGAHDGTAA